MKISSASKKVLASALSAAMVVAFAPTVAFGGTPTGTAKADGAKTVTVTFNANGGTVTSGCAGYTAELLKDEAGKYFVQVNDTNTASDAAYGEQAGWFVDADGDGLYNSKTEKAVDGGYIEVSADTTAVELKAYYTVPALEFADSAFAGTGVTYSNGSISDAKASSLTVTVKNDGKAGHAYVLTVKNPNGDTVGTQTFSSAADADGTVDKLAGDHVVYFTANPVTGDNMAAWAEKLVSGEYTATVTDNGKEISKAKVSLAKVTTKVGEDSSSQFVQLGADGSKQVTLAALTSPYVAYLDADGYNATTTPTVTGDATFTATKVAQSVSDVAYTATAGKHGTIGFTLSGSAVKYAVSVSDKDGVIYTGEYTATGAKTVSFDVNAGGARANAAEKAGTYVVTVVATDSYGDETTSKAKMDLTEVKYAVSDGVEFQGNYAKAAYQTAYTSAVPAGFADINDVAKAKTNYKLASAWQLNGKAYNAKSNKLKVGESNTLTATATANSLAAAPSYSVAKSTAGSTTSYVLTVTPVAGTSVVVKHGSTTETAITSAKAFILDGKEDVTITASAAGVSDNVIELKQTSGLVKAWTDATASGASKFELLLGNTGTKWSAATGVKAAIESGKASYEALAGKFYVSAAEIADADLAAWKALYEAADAEANAQVKAYENGADVVAGKKVYNMTSAKYKAATEAIADSEKVVTRALKDATKAEQTAAYQKGVNGESSYKGIVVTANEALKTADENKQLTAADVEAAQKVSEQLKAAKTADEAKAALEAYSKLTDAQKALVATADVTAAQKVVSDAETAQKLVDSQDLAAARDLNGKKVTAKAKVGKKAQGKSFTYKLAASESGATASYAKVSGSKYIKVSASGKVTFSKVKVQKKAKTYKAKVSVTYGTQTVTKTVQLVVKKK